MSPTVVVTGGGGFIGQALVEAEAGRGRRVRSLDVAHPRPLPSGLSPPPERIDGSVLDEELLGRLCRGAEVVYHLAAAHHEVRADEAHFRAVNVEGTRRVVRAAAAAGVRRVVHVSTVGVYGQLDGRPRREEDPPHPTIPYERTKLAGETAAWEEGRRAGVEVVVARPSWIYGPGCRRTLKIFRAVARRRFLLIGSGRPRRDGLYIDDCVRGLQLLAARPEAAGETFLLASGEAPRVAEWVAAIAAELEVPPPRWRVPVAPMWLLGWTLERVYGLAGRDAPFSRRSLKFFTNATVFDPAKIRRLGFAPRVSWREGIRRTAAAFREAGRLG